MGQSLLTLESLLEKVEKLPDAPGCWLWTGTTNAGGYGVVWYRGRTMTAHRASLMLHGHPCPDGKDADHLCRVRSCVNPSHLEMVTHRENVLRGVGEAAKYAVRTHCKNGHEFTPENTNRYPNRRGARNCRKCDRASWKRYEARKAAGLVGLALAFVLFALPASAEKQFKYEVERGAQIASLKGWRAVRSAQLASLRGPLFQILPASGSGGGGSSNIAVNTTGISGGTDCGVLYNNAGTVGNGGATFCFDDVAISLNVGAAGAGTGATLLNQTASGSSATSNFLSVTATNPATLTAAFNFFNLPLTTAGASAQAVRGINVDLGAGFTGNAEVAGVRVANPVVGGGSATIGFDAVMSGGATSEKLGFRANITNGLSTANNAGFYVSTNTAADNYGFQAHIANDSTNWGGIFAGALADPPAGKYAGGFSNGATTGDQLRLYDNTTLTGLYQDAGSSWEKIGTKTLTDATPTAFVRVSVPSTGRQGGIAMYCVDANDATNQQTRCGSVSFAFVNEAGTEGCTGIGTPADADGTPTGTLTVAFTGASNAADTCDLLANATSSLTETTLRINYHVRLYGNAATAVAAVP